MKFDCKSAKLAQYYAYEFCNESTMVSKVIISKKSDYHDLGFNDIF